MAGEKKTNPKVDSKKLEKMGKEIKAKAQQVSEKIEKTTDHLEEKFEKEIKKGKESLSGVSKRRNETPTAEKVTTILGVFFLFRGVIKLWHVLPGILLIVIGIIFVTGILNPLFEEIFGHKKSK